MRGKSISTSMGIALTLLAAGIIVQVTDYFEFFGHNSVIPLIIGLIVVVIGFALFLLRHWRASKANER